MSCSNCFSTFNESFSLLLELALVPEVAEATDVSSSSLSGSSLLWAKLSTDDALLDWFDLLLLVDALPTLPPVARLLGVRATVELAGVLGAAEFPGVLGGFPVAVGEVISVVGVFLDLVVVTIAL